VRQHSPGQEVSKLLLNECGQRGAVRVTAGRLKESVEVLVDHAIQQAVLGVAWPVVAGIEGHTSDIGASRERRQCPKMETSQQEESPTFRRNPW